MPNDLKHNAVAPRHYSRLSNDGSCTPGGLSSSTHGRHGSHWSDGGSTTATAPASSMSRASSARWVQRRTPDAAGVLSNVSLGGGVVGDDASFTAVHSVIPRSLSAPFAAAFYRPQPFDQSDELELPDSFPPKGASSKALPSRKPHPPTGPGAAPRLTIKVMEARQAYEIRLVRHWEQQRVAAVRAIVAFFRKLKERRAAREAFRRSREAVIIANIQAHRRDVLRRRFRSIVSRQVRRSHNPTQQWRWVRLQAWVRGYLARRDCQAMRAAALHERSASAVALKTRAAAVTIQSHWRRYYVQRRVVNVRAFLATRRAHAARVMQRSVRWFLFCRPAARRWATKSAYRRYRAAAKIQRVWRAWRSFCELTHSSSKFVTALAVQS